METPPPGDEETRRIFKALQLGNGAISGCTKLGLPDVAPVSIWLLWFHGKGTRQYRFSRDSFAGVLVPIPVQSWDQGRSGSIGVTPAQLPVA